MVDLYSFKQKGDTTAGWAASSVPLQARQMAVEYPVTGPPRLKFGSLAGGELFGAAPYSVDQVFTTAEKSKLGRMVTAAEYGLVSGGAAATNRAALQAAVDAVTAAGGGMIYIFPGQYQIDAQININTSGIWIVGAGSYCTEIIATNATMHCFVVGDGITPRAHIGFAHFSFNTTLTKTGGACIWTNLCQWIEIHSMRIAGHFRGLRFTKSVNCLACSIEMLVLTNGTGVGVLIDGIGYPSNDHYLRDIMVSGSGTVPLCGYMISNSGGTWLETCGALDCVSGLIINPSTGQTVEHLFSSRNAWDTCTANGALIQPDTGRIVRRCTFMGDWTATCGQSGILTTGAGTVNGLQIIGHRSYQNQFHGMLFEIGDNILVSDSTVAGNSASLSNTYDGISLGGVTNFRILGNACGGTDGYGPSHRYGIAVKSAASVNYIVSNNWALANVTGTIQNLGSAPSLVTNNLS